MPVASPRSLGTSSSSSLTKRKRDYRDDTPTEGLDDLSQSGTLLLPTTSLVDRRNRKLLRIEIPVRLAPEADDTHVSATDTLFSAKSLSSLFSASDADSVINDLKDFGGDDTAGSVIQDDRKPWPALLDAPEITGLSFTPSVRIPQELADTIMAYCMETYFKAPGVNQIMLFERFLLNCESPGSKSTSGSGFPPILLSLLDTLSSLLRPILPSKSHELLFPERATQARQAILNLYQPGEGITPHVDLLGRFGDGIVGVSFGSGCVMRFDKVPSETETRERGAEGEDDSRWELYLPERSVIVLSEEARYEWTHGIDERKEDFVSCGNGEKDSALSQGRWIGRGVRLSVTFRWLLPGADVVGDGVKT
ncbi:uncharacterized protein LACBIDRAFT_292682 [Laccaria bicolor S238N-H82]|uniref:Predicted protein n=1 Tax=Laccaria bicolor (strain S238N-H82 / ATCC MYA-4686) TaxID=486041 RepID=B0CZJ7_LACBS|nr:uncharacterized protein LACBIDRAFT_292682 [Laccaria bicolor S238N-H82]EDR12155.1 predicted protein [Laccaria bicolor S238N-H82]|eukprot:XP_001876419.1 predicted protein [Laccaria bicolor S238N-H82]